ncbi:hypothetical protein, conserved [Trypanosoma brucei brucei TREU927]|uniref:Uncharacterized protein n=1 Tax=Trypanosoma brucei brucei (strain 927/4 GUTat10.1) TaxID=185431 RepID=Q386S8_TRYB2|nr:hypothetical protein, conserved [Trypanosoma brucei brucei TREU927]EAN79203.1 hypothetical protein, conserved [Trypanosoma brucei brucei TREU927]
MYHCIHHQTHLKTNCSFHVFFLLLKNMYKQHTNFAAANTPLFTQLFGSVAADTSKPQQRVEKDTSEEFNRRNSADPAQLSRGRIVEMQSSGSKRYQTADSATQTTLPCSEVVGSNTEETTQNFLRACQPQEVGPPPCAEFKPMDVEGGADISVEDDVPAWKKPTIPFRKMMQELEKRFHEQMDVHRGLKSTMERLDVLRSEISLYQAEQRTAKLAEALHQKNAYSIERAAQLSASAYAYAESLSAFSPKPPPAITTAPPQQQTKAAASETTPFLKSILESYQKEREGKTRGKNGEATDVPVKKALSVDIIRQPEEPLPYKRVYYVPVVEEKPNSVSAVREDGVNDVNSTVREGNGAGASTSSVSVVAAGPSAASNSEISIESGGVSANTSVGSSEVGTNVISQSLDTDQVSETRSLSAASSRNSPPSPTSSTPSVNELSASTGHSSIADETGSSIKSSHSTNILATRNEGKAEPLVTTLKEFYRACGNANRLMQALLGRNIRLTAVTPKKKGDAYKEREEHSASSESSDSRNVKQSEKPEWLAALKRDVRDIRKLRRFIDRMKRNIKSIDCHHRAQEVRRKLFVKAQRLAKAQRRVRNNMDAVSDVMDEIADIIRSDASGAGDEDEVVDDISVAFSAEGSDSIMDEVDDEFNFGGTTRSGGGISDEVDDEVVDELQQSRLGSADDDVVTDVVSELSWAKEESDFAEALAEVSDINDLLDDEVPLPDEESLMDDVVDEDLPPASSIETEGSIEDRVAAAGVDDVADNVISGAVDGIVDDVEDAASSAVITEESSADNADVSSVMPASSASTRSSEDTEDSVKRMRDMSMSRIYDDTESAESALNELERAMRIPTKQRSLSSSGAHPVNFLGLDIQNAMSAETLVTEELKDGYVVRSDSHTWESTLHNDVAFPPAPADITLSADINTNPPTLRSLSTPTSVASVAGLPVKAPGCANYETDDIVAQLNWKERQLLLFEKIHPKTMWTQAETEDTPADAEGPVEGRAGYHWGMLETLLQYRFALNAVDEAHDDITDYVDDFEDIIFDDYDA